MAKELILIGGGDYRKKENQKIDAYIKSRLNSDSKILVIPLAVKEKNRKLSRFNSISTALKEKGLKNFEIINEDEESINQIINKINFSNALFITGGDPKLLLKSLKKLKLIKLIKEYKGIIIGYSAGAMILSKKCVIPGGIEKEYPRTVILKGLGIIEFNVSPHYKKEHDSILKSLSKKYDFYGITDKSALICKDSNLFKIGRVIHFHKKTRTEL